MNDTNLIEDLRLLSPPDHRWALVLAVAVMTVLALLWWWRRHPRLRPAAPDAPESPGAPPWETALAELERLTALLHPDTSRAYAMASTAVLRGYVEQRYGLQAPRLATEEFLVAASRAEALPPDHREGLGRFLRLGDLLKFGRYTATAGELGELHAAALAFVMASRPNGETVLAGRSREDALPVGTTQPHP
jgi:hypothetical protein